MSTEDIKPALLSTDSASTLLDSKMFLKQVCAFHPVYQTSLFRRHGTMGLLDELLSLKYRYNDYGR